ncbi:Unknown protein [Striga hermonthica]|uniref:Uncharacterized protein n=1 Tax=Striga hermonthica TaxID=68872 RepID=A0A9N7NGF2_STRHE|nr:Unknown protein [Striga hermonthica]
MLGQATKEAEVGGLGLSCIVDSPLLALKSTPQTHQMDKKPGLIGDLTVDLKSHLQTLYAQSFRITLASSHDLWAFYLHAALLRQAFAHCGKVSGYNRLVGLATTALPY